MRKTIVCLNYTVLVTLLFNCAAFGKDKEEIVDAWKHNFQNLRSMYVDYKMVVKVADGKEPELEFNAKFASDGAKFLSEIKMPKQISSLSSLVTAYDGKHYQALSVEGEQSYLNRWTKRKQEENPYNGGNPLLTLYEFVFYKGDEWSLETLQGSAIWERLAARVIKTENAERGGRKGTLLVVRSRGSKKVQKEHYEVFVDDVTNAPTYWKVVAEDSGELQNELVVTDTKEWREEGKSLTFPLIMTWTKFADNKIREMDVFETDPKTLRFNQPIKPEIFTIPLSQATRFTDEDERKEKEKEARKAGTSGPSASASPKKN